MPVGTQATVKGLSQRDLLEDLGAPFFWPIPIILYLRPGHETVKRLGGLHGFMSWPNAILTDSGGFQVFSLSGLRKITEDGVRFQSHLNGDAHMFTPRIDSRCATGVRQRHHDGARRMPGVSGEPRVRAGCMERTVRWARAGDGTLRADGLRRAGDTARSVSDRAGIDVPGSAAGVRGALVDLDADGYAVGGLSVGEPRPLSLEMVEATRGPAAARTGRATPWESGCRRSCRSTWRAEST